MVAYAGGNPYNNITITIPDVHIRPVINKTTDFPVITSPDTNGVVIRADNVTLCRLAITGCNASFEDGFLGAVGGGILAYECKNTTIKRCNIIDNHAFTGGGIAFVRAEGSVRGPVITGNTADNGGGISIYDADFSLYNATTRENSALNGGGLMSGESKFNIHNSNFSENNASNGGGIYLLSTTKGNIFYSVVYDNYADNSGGGIYTMMSKIAIHETNILKNSAKYGGGIYSATSTSSFYYSEFNNNSAKCGGGYEGYHAYTDFHNCDFTNNTAENGAGIAILNGEAGIYKTTVSLNRIDNYTETEPVTRATVSNTLLSNITEELNITVDRTPAIGIGILVRNTDELIICNSIIEQNSPATNDTFFVIGGGIAIVESEGTISSTTVIRGNDAHIGAGICAFKSNLTLTDTSFRRNEAQIAGGGITALMGTTSVTETTIINNSAGISGGGICHLIGNATITDSTISRNNALLYGGGIQTIIGTTEIQGNTIRENNAGLGGGGICQLTGINTITGNIISSNTAGNGTGLFTGGAGILTAGLDIESDDFSLISALLENQQENFSALLNNAVSDREISPETTERMQATLEEYISSGTDNQTPNLLTNITSELNADIENTLIRISDNKIQQNTAKGSGGGFKIIGASALVDNNTIRSNSASGAGGGIGGISSTILLKSNTFRNNKGALGGGVSSILSTLLTENTQFKENNGTLYGGGVSSIGGAFFALNNNFTDNNAGIGGGGLNSVSNSFITSLCNFSGNTAQDGGGINLAEMSLSEETLLSLHNSLGVIQNAEEDGPSLLPSPEGDNSPTVVGSANLLIKIMIDTTLDNNSASYGGGIKITDTENIYIIGFSITNNTATTAGGGMYVSDSNRTSIAYNIIAGNTAPTGAGAGCYLKDSYTLNLYDNIFRNTENLIAVSDNSTAEDWDLRMNASYRLGEPINGGPYNGGNVWTNPEGTGFSVTQNDTNFDGICDDSYTITDTDGSTVGVDHLPLYYNLSRGTIRAGTRPRGADVLIDGQSYNRTTWSGYYLPPAEYAVKMTLAGYFNSPVFTTPVTTGYDTDIYYTFSDTPTFRHTDTGPSPLTFVANATKTATDVSAWTWYITQPDGSVTELTGRNISAILRTTGAYTITLNATWADKTTRSETQTVSVLDTPPAPKASEKTSAAINGTSVELTPEGTQTIHINESSAGNVTTTGTDILVKKNDGTTVHIVTNGTNTTAGNVSGTVRSVTVTPPVLNATISDTVGNASVGLAMTMDTYDEDATITTEIAAGCAADAKNAFSLACPNLNQVAYTVYFTKSGFDNESAISGAVLNFSVNTSWVTSMGGPGMITIIRWTDDGNSTQITPTYLGISGGESLFQVVTDGFSVYGVASTSASSSGGSSGSGGTSSVGVAATSDLKAGEITTLSLKNTAVTQVGILPAVNIKDLMITVENKYGPESGILPPDETVYQYDLVTLYKADANDIAEITYTFEIPKDWLSVQHALPALWQYNTTAEEWIAYATHIIGDDAFAVISEATCPDVGWIALGGVPGEMVPEDTEEIIIVAEDGEGGNTPKETSPEPEETASPFGVAGLLVGLGAAAMLRRKI